MGIRTWELKCFTEKLKYGVPPANVLDFRQTGILKLSSFATGPSRGSYVLSAELLTERATSEGAGQISIPGSPWPVAAQSRKVLRVCFTGLWDCG